MTHLAWGENWIAGFHPKGLGSDLHDIFPFNRIEPLVLIEVQMTWGAPLLPIRKLHDEETTIGVLGCDLEIGWTDADGVVFAKPVLARRNPS
jgi:hypothetical protein